MTPPPPYFIMLSQVLSKSVADALAYFGDPATKETEHFIRQFDRLFDCLNVRSLSEWSHKNKPDLKPYTSPDDSRLEVCVAQWCCYHITIIIIIISGSRKIF